MPPPGASEKASVSEVGDHTAPPIGSTPLVTCVGHPPCDETIQTCGVPLRSLIKAMRLPSGEKLGELERPTRAIRSTASVSGSAAKAEAVSVSRASSSRRRMRLDVRCEMAKVQRLDDNSAA